MSGVSFKFIPGEAITRATVNQNFTDLVTASSTIEPSAVLDGTILPVHINPTDATVLKDFYQHKREVSVAAAGAKTPIAGSNATGGAQITQVGNNDVILVSAFAEFEYNNPLAAAVFLAYDIGTLSIDSGIPAANVPIPGDGGVDSCSRIYETQHGVNGGKYDSIVRTTCQLDWTFQAVFPHANSPQYITLYWHPPVTNANLTCTSAGVYVYIIKR